MIFSKRLRKILMSVLIASFVALALVIFLYVATTLTILGNALYGILLLIGFIAFLLILGAFAELKSNRPSKNYRRKNR